MSHRVRTGRWRGGLIATLGLLALGFLYAAPAVVAGAAVPLTYVVYGALSRVPRSEVRARREVEPADPSPKGAATVSLTVTNASERTLTDLRVVDGVPNAATVTDGPPRAAFALRPGESGTVAYEVRVEQGEHGFEDPVVRLRSTAASERETRTVPATGDKTLTCMPTLDPPVPADAASRRSGTLTVEDGGSGISFHTIREYRRGDPMSRVDWRHYAKTGEFVTVQYRRERTVRTVVVVDARELSRLTGPSGRPTGAELSAYAARQMYDALNSSDLAASVTVVGIDPAAVGGVVGRDGLPWIDTAEAGREHVETFFGRLREIAGHSDSSQATKGGATAADDSGMTATELLRSRLSPTAQVVLCTPLLDDWPVEAARTLAARESPFVVLSPDVTTGSGTGQRVAAVRRDARLKTLAAAGTHVVDWDPNRPIDRALSEGIAHLL